MAEKKHHFGKLLLFGAAAAAAGAACEAARQSGQYDIRGDLREAAHKAAAKLGCTASRKQA